MHKTIALVIAWSLAGCNTTGTPTEVRYQTVTVVKRGPCPDKATYEKLKGSRPTPLRDQPMPASAVERAARIVAQLGLYEGTGQWADRVAAVLDRCQAEGLAPQG